MGPRAGLDGRKLLSPPGFDPGPSARSQSLYRLSYPTHIYIYTHTHTMTGLKFKEETSKALHLEHGFVWC